MIAQTMNTDAKLIVIVGSAYPLRGGIANFNERLARALTQCGHKVIIITFSLQYPAFLFPGKSQYSTEQKPSDLDIRVGINTINPISWIKWGIKIKRMAPQIIIMKYWIPFVAPCLGTISRIVRTNKKTKAISIIDNLIPHEPRPFDNILTRYFVAGVDGLIALSKDVFNQLEDYSNKPRCFSPHPVYDNYGSRIDKNKAREILGLQQNDKIALFFGFIRDYKGLDLLLEAMTEAKIRQEEIMLLVAGEFYTDPAPYLSFIKKNGLEKRVILNTNFIPDSQVSIYFSAADLVVQPYKHATQSGVTQIAFHFEVPMVVTDVGGLTEFVADGKAGFITKPQPADIAFAMLKYFGSDEKELFLQFVKNEKHRYSWDFFTQSISELYKTIVKPQNKTYGQS